MTTVHTKRANTMREACATSAIAVGLNLRQKWFAATVKRHTIHEASATHVGTSKRKIISRELTST